MRKGVIKVGQKALRLRRGADGLLGDFVAESPTVVLITLVLCLGSLLNVMQPIIRDRFISKNSKSVH